MMPSRAWRPAIGRYLAVTAAGSLAWEFAQTPLYTLWRTGSVWGIAFAVLHCTVGDVLIAGALLAASLLLFGAAGWPRSRFLRVAAPAVIVGLGITVLVERLATAWGIWTYSELMPVVPGLGTGLAPLAQWVVVPSLAFMAARLPTGGKLQRVGGDNAFDPATGAVTTSAAEAGYLTRPIRRA